MREVRDWWLAEAKRLFVGETTRLVHPADRGARPSVMIRNMSDRWSTWCHRRNTGDVVFKDHVIPYKAPKESATATVPDDMVAFNDLPHHEQNEMAKFLATKNVSLRMLPEILYSKDRQRLIIHTDCQFLTGRDLTETHPIKWVEYTRRGKKHIGFVSKGGRVVLVEDILSYYKLRYALRDTDWEVLCLLGTVLRPSAALEVSRASEVLVMLDGDSAGRSGTRRVVRDVQGLAGPEVRAVYLPEGYDPKDLTIQQIREHVLP